MWWHFNVRHWIKYNKFLLSAFPSNPFYRFFYFFNKIKLSMTMTKRLSSIKEGLQSYCNKVYSRSSFNKMWILKYSHDLLDNFNSREVHLSKKRSQQFTNHSSWKCINTFKEIICNAVSYKMVTNVTNKGNNKINELQTILQRESQNS